MFTISDIIKKIPVQFFLGNESQVIRRAIQLNSSNQEDDVIMWASDTYIGNAYGLNKGTLIVSENVDASKFPELNLLVVKNPRSYFRKLLELFFSPSLEYAISESASIHSSVKLGEKICIGNNVVVEKNCVIEDDVVIGSNTVICEGTIIKRGVRIGCNCTIGGVGFGYEKDEEGYYQLIPHIGNVVIHEFAHIGNNTCIDRAVLGSTVIGKNVKIDNLVHVAHNVQVEENSMLIANCMIGGSVIIGKDVWVAPSASIINNIEIQEKALIGLGAVVVKNVAKDTIVIGNPARPKG